MTPAILVTIYTAVRFAMTAFVCYIICNSQISDVLAFILTLIAVFIGMGYTVSERTFEVTPEEKPTEGEKIDS